MPTLLHDASLIQNQDPVGQRGLREPVRHQHSGATPEPSRPRSPGPGAGRLGEDGHERVGEGYPGQGQLLTC